ncbi:MAG: exo-alpha-sialidase, partial [Planctomycetota bacterium]
RINMYPEYRGEDPEGYNYLCEPHVVEVSPGRLLGMARYEERPGRGTRQRRSVLWQFKSDDGGHTWSTPEPTEILGKPPHLTRLADGRILLTYGYRHEPYGQRACLSEDGGDTWDYDNEIILRDDAPTGDLGYPASVQLDDGTIMTVYYQQERKDQKTVLMTSHWCL